MLNEQTKTILTVAVGVTICLITAFAFIAPSFGLAVDETLRLTAASLFGGMAATLGLVGAASFGQQQEQKKTEALVQNAVLQAQTSK